MSAGARAGFDGEKGAWVNENLAARTILVVDDEDDVRESVREVLSDEGYRVIDTGDRTARIHKGRHTRPGPAAHIEHLPTGYGRDEIDTDPPNSSLDRFYEAVVEPSRTLIRIHRLHSRSVSHSVLTGAISQAAPLPYRQRDESGGLRAQLL